MRQVLRAGALGRPIGMGWRRGRRGEAGWVTHVNPWLIHVNVWQKPLKYHKVISLQLIKINGKKWYLNILISTTLFTNECECFFTYLLDICDLCPVKHFFFWL